MDKEYNINNYMREKCQGETKLKYLFRLFIPVILLTILLHSEVYSQDKRVYLNPGIKLGYQFGSGFIFGLELSSVWEFDNDPRWGVLVDLDFCSKAQFVRLNIAGEGHLNFVGMSAGPSVTFQNSKAYYGITTVVYSPLILLVPYVGSTFASGYPFNIETGSYLKVPVIIKGHPISIGG